MDSVGNAQRKVFEVLHVWGLDRPGKFKLIPPQAFYKFPDGSTRTDYRAFQRIIEIELGAINADEDFLRAFFQADAKSFAYQGNNIVAEEVQVVYESPSVEDEWFDNYKHTKKFVFELTESTIRNEWPVPVTPTVTDIMYIKTKVKIEGTQAAPETFTTNSGKLQYNYGTTSFPGISLLSYIVTVLCNGAPYQDAKINQVGNVTQSGSNISFQLAVSDTGNPSSDGFFYADITIGLQLIV